MRFVIVAAIVLLIGAAAVATWYVWILLGSP
jgi:hypothetical protein